MASVIHQMQGLYGGFPLTSLSWNKGTNWIQRVSMPDRVNGSDKHISLKRSLSLKVTGIRGSNLKPLKISAFKGNAQNDESGSKTNRSMFPKNSVELSYVPQGSEETMKESSEVQNVLHSCSSEVNQAMTGSPAAHNLFKKWLTMLHPQSQSHVAGLISQEKSHLIEYFATQSGTQKANMQWICKAVWLHFLSLDMKIKIPLVIFIPGYLAIKFVYGAEVLRELLPLWVLGPLITALYIKLFQLICALYVLSFKTTVHVIKNTPTYWHRKLKEDILTRVWQPWEQLKNMNSRELLRMMLEGFLEWVTDKYLDYVESIWPFYCRMIRFLKRAYLI